MKTDILELAAEIFASNRLSHSERQHLAAVLSEEDLNEQERTVIKRILYGVRHGMFQVVE